MKKFVYIEDRRNNSGCGGFNVGVWVYSVKRNLPHYILEASWNTASFYGEESEVMHALSKAGHIQKKYVEGYYRRDNGTFLITKVGR